MSNTFNTLHSSPSMYLQVCTNGYISIGSEYLSYMPFRFMFRSKAIVAPFFYDVDLRNGGSIEYETHTSGQLLQSVSYFVSKNRGIDFNARWMLLVYWNKVAPHYEGNSSRPLLVRLYLATVMLVYMKTFKGCLCRFVHTYQLV